MKTWRNKKIRVEQDTLRKLVRIMQLKISVIKRNWQNTVRRSWRPFVVPLFHVEMLFSLKQLASKMSNGVFLKANEQANIESSLILYVDQLSQVF